MNLVKIKELLKTKRDFIITIVIVLFLFISIYIIIDRRLELMKVDSITNKETLENIKTDFSSFWKTWNIVNDKSPDAFNVNDQYKVYGAISGLVGSLGDPYSVFFNPEETKAFKEEINGNFTGLGIEIGIKNKVLTVVAPLKDTPAQRAGIKPGDQIIKVDDILTSNIDIEESIKLIRGERGTSVTLTIFRKDFKEPKEFVIVRDIINIPTLDTELRPDGIFVIQLYSFSANSTVLFNQAMKEFVAAGTNKLILDLRGNPGGYLDAAVDVASYFLPGGKVVVTEDYGGTKKEKVFRSRGYSNISDNFKFAVLIDGGSASASEIVAGAIQDYGVGKIIGEQSFGKGSVQEVIEITNDTSLKLTVAKWLTPDGNLIEEKGLTPDYKVSISKKDVNNKIDSQMNKAVQLLNN